MVRMSATPPPVRPVLAFSAPSELVAGLDLSEGAKRVYAVMHRLACDVAWLRGHKVAPDTVTMHVPALVVAGLAGYTTRHLRRLLPELMVAKLVAGGPHASRVGLRSLWDGCLWSIKVRAGQAVPVVQPAEWKHPWRPGFEADVVGKTGAAEFMSALQTLELNDAEKTMAAAHASVTAAYGAKPAAVSSSADMGGGRVQDVVYRLGELPRVHARKRRALVDELGGLLAQAVDGGSKWKRLWCGVIWRTWNSYVEGRSGELQALGAALLRLEVDRVEGARMRNAGAVLVARLRPT
ncbi:hypothetical protein [Deinococcus aerophilus]|uniref:hypothetical protein n=1 Tax=Deinococcus aerophilus TaxID=522488 RepID=UPI00166811AA|nr:hypothetical protein [Deinococcus aerophilus]